MRHRLLLVLPFLLPAASLANDFDVQFEWGDIPLCTTGYPNKVGNPEFHITGLPEKTEVLVFKLKDLDAGNYSHGGGKIKRPDGDIVPRFAFTYQSPCPKDGVHTYEWRVIAKGMGEVLGVSKVQREYPETPAE